MGGRGGGSGMKKKAGGGGGGSLTSEQAQVQKNYSEYVDEMEQKISRAEQDGLALAKQRVDMYKNTSTKTSMLEQMDRSQFAKTEMMKARKDAVKNALNNKDNLTNEKMNRIEIEAAKQFASSKVKVPNSYTGKSSPKTPRTVDMREFFSPDGNPYNYNQRGGIYSAIKRDWGESVARNFKKHNVPE